MAAGGIVSNVNVINPGYVGKSLVVYRGNEVAYKYVIVRGLSSSLLFFCQSSSNITFKRSAAGIASFFKVVLLLSLFGFLLLGLNTNKSTESLTFTSFL